MKNVVIFLIIFAITLGLNSCKSDDDNKNNNDPKASSPLYKKWVVQDSPPASQVENRSFRVNLKGMESIEFSKDGVFVIVEKDGKVTKGTYTIGDGVLTLTDVGTITINELNDSELNSTFKVGDQTFNLFFKPAEAIATKASNQAMFKLWKIKNIEELQKGKQASEIIVSTEVLITPYGTYLSKSVYQGGDYIEIFNDYWKWKNKDQTEICYRNPDETGGDKFDCEKDFFTILSLSDTELRVLFPADEHDEEQEIILVPAN